MTCRYFLTHITNLRRHAVMYDFYKLEIVGFCEKHQFIDRPNRSVDEDFGLFLSLLYQFFTLFENRPTNYYKG